MNPLRYGMESDILHKKILALPFDEVLMLRDDHIGYDYTEPLCEARDRGGDVEEYNQASAPPHKGVDEVDLVRTLTKLDFNALHFDLSESRIRSQILSTNHPGSWPSVSTAKFAWT